MLYASLESVKPHALRTPQAHRPLPQNKDARELFAAMTRKDIGNVILKEEELRILGIGGGITALPGMTIEEVLLEGVGNEYSLFLLPDDQGFGALKRGRDSVQIFKFDRNLKLIWGWEKDAKGSFSPLNSKLAQQASLACIKQWKNTTSE